jgi:hypothetical protein
MKRIYLSGSKKQAEKTRKIQAAVVGTPTINTFLCISTTGANKYATAGSEDRVSEEVGVDDDVPATCTAAPTDAEDSTKAAQIDITSTAPWIPSTSPDLECDLFKLDRAYPTDRAHFPLTIKSTSLKSMILSYGPCQPTGPYEDDETGRPVFSNKHYHYFSTGNLKVNRNWLCFSPSLKKPYCHTCWLFADRCNPNLQWQWIDGVPGSS